MGAPTARKAQQLDLLSGLGPAQSTAQSDELLMLRAKMRTMAAQLEAAKLIQKRNEAKIAELLDMVFTSRTQQSTDGSIEALKRELIKLAHPDKWSQGQAAIELAHEITVRLTASRPRRS